MATAELLFDAAYFRYPQYVNGLPYIVEQVTMNFFVIEFAAANSSTKFTWDQLRECWFYFLRGEHGLILSKSPNLTLDQIGYFDGLLSRGFKQADTLQRLPAADWEAAEYEPDKKGNDDDDDDDDEYLLRDQRVVQYRKPQDYDPMLLLQSLPEIAFHAKRFYEVGVEKFLRKTIGIYDRVKVEGYKLSCVCMAQEHVKQLLRATYLAEKGEEASQVANSEETTLVAQRVKPRWDRGTQWTALWNQMREERRKIAAELGPLMRDGIIIDSSIPTGPSNLSRYRAGGRKRPNRLLRTLQRREQTNSTNTVGELAVQTRSMSMKKQTEQYEVQQYEKSISDIERGFETLLRDEYNPGLSLHLEQPYPVEVEDAEALKPTQAQIFARMKRSRRERKSLVRREEVEKRLIAGCEKGQNPHIPVLSNPNPSAMLMDQPRSTLTTRRKRGHEKTAHFFKDISNQGHVLFGKGSDLSASYEPTVKVEEESRPSSLLTLATRIGEPGRANMTNESLDVPESCVREDMDTEMSGRIAKLEM